MLVALGKRFDHEVMAELLEKLAPGSLPHYFVVQTLASFSSSNCELMVYICICTTLVLLKQNSGKGFRVYY